MKINVASLTLRFYKVDGWTEEKVKKLLVDKKMEITYRADIGSNAKKELLGDLSYYAVYEKSGYKVFKQSEIGQHELIGADRFGGKDNIIDWYVKEGV